MLMGKYPSVITTLSHYCRVHLYICLDPYLMKGHPIRTKFRKFPTRNLETLNRVMGSYFLIGEYYMGLNKKKNS